MYFGMVCHVTELIFFLAPCIKWIYEYKILIKIPPECVFVTANQIVYPMTVDADCGTIRVLL